MLGRARQTLGSRLRHAASGMNHTWKATLSSLTGDRLGSPTTARLAIQRCCGATGLRVVVWNPRSAVGGHRRGPSHHRHRSPGYGLSTTQSGRTIAQWVPDALAVADHLGIARFVAVGVSTGGAYALATAALAPDRVLGVVACCSMTDMRWSDGRSTMSKPHAHDVWDAPTAPPRSQRQKPTGSRAPDARRRFERCVASRWISRCGGSGVDA